MKRRPAVLFLLAGFALLGLLLPLTGWLAAVAPPDWLNQASREHPKLAELAWTLWINSLPMLVASAIFGAVVFRLAGEASTRAVVWAAIGLLLPLCLMQVLLMLAHGAKLAAFGELLTSPNYWLALVAPTLGLWIAARVLRRSLGAA